MCQDRYHAARNIFVELRTFVFSVCSTLFIRLLSWFLDSLPGGLGRRFTRNPKWPSVSGRQNFFKPQNFREGARRQSGTLAVHLNAWSSWGSTVLAHTHDDSSQPFDWFHFKVQMMLDVAILTSPKSCWEIFREMSDIVSLYQCSCG